MSHLDPKVAAKHSTLRCTSTNIQAIVIVSKSGTEAAITTPLAPTARSAPRKRAAIAFGRALKAARKAKGLSQEQLAEVADCDRTYPSLLERGLRTPTFCVIIEFAHGLDMTPVDLFTQAIAKLEQLDKTPDRRTMLANKS